MGLFLGKRRIKRKYSTCLPQRLDVPATLRWSRASTSTAVARCTTRRPSTSSPRRPLPRRLLRRSQPLLRKRSEAPRTAAAAAGKKDGDIFEAKKESYKPSEQRKADQQTVDKSLMEALKKHADAKLLKQYLRTGFGLSKGEYPHKMVF